MSAFYSWTEAVKYLKSLVVRSTPLAGPGIALEQTPAGRRISLEGHLASGGSSSYAGQFMLKASNDDDESYLEVVNGALDEDVQQDNPCGKVKVGGNLIDIDSYIDNAPTPASGYVYVEVSYTYADDATTPIYTAAIKLNTGVPADYHNGAWTVVTEIGTYATDTNGDISVTQVWTDGIIYVEDRWM